MKYKTLLLILCSIWMFYLIRDFEPYKSVMLTISNKAIIPKYIHEQWIIYFRGDVTIFDNTECSSFLNKFYGQKYAEQFNYLTNGAHKADLFRYAWLYKNGGIYMDIKTILIKSIEYIFNNSKHAYFVITKPDRIYNGIIATPKNSPIIKMLLDDMMKFTNESEYLSVGWYGYNTLKHFLNTSKLNAGTYTSFEYPIHILEEKFYHRMNCVDHKLDRYGFCTYATNQHNERVIKIRDASYPWV